MNIPVRIGMDTSKSVSRKQPGAVLHDPEEAAARVLRMVRFGALETQSGRQLSAAIDTICVHSDTPTAVAVAAAVPRTMEDAGIAIRSLQT